MIQKKVSLEKPAHFHTYRLGLEADRPNILNGSGRSYLPDILVWEGLAHESSSFRVEGLQDRPDAFLEVLLLGVLHQLAPARAMWLRPHVCYNATT